MAEVKQPTANVIWGASGGLCCICKQQQIHANDDDQFPLGFVAHIEGHRENSKRYRADMSEEERNHFDNLMLLCGQCHTMIDKDDTTYTVEKLKQIKKNHEQSIADQLRGMVLQVTFAELEVTLKYLITASSENNAGTLQVIPTKDKITKNNLSDSVENLIKMGLTQQKQIDDYLNKNPDMNLSKTLRSAFVKKYDELKSQELESDAIFYYLLDFASNNSSDFKFRAGGLAVVAYYFQVCDVFEK